jgi:ssDNA-binding Zn-finger/Zn-ribbon topoisomerase 1
MEEKKEEVKKDVCPKCGSALGEITETKSGKQLRRCSAGSWNSETRSVEGCDYVLWITPEPKQLDEKCPKCGAPLVEAQTKFGKKMKKCSTNTWDPKTKTASGCDYIEWISASSTEELDEECPQCGQKLVMYTSAKGKSMKKCSTNKWDPKTKESTGCNYVQWM